jgi:predicted DNA-binding transcriptional regulator AlpA
MPYQQETDAPTAPAVLRIPRAAQYIGVSTRQFYNIESRDPTFPRSIQLGPKARGVLRESLDRWLKEQEAKAERGVA